MFRHSVRVWKRLCFYFKIRVLLPQTWQEMSRRFVKNIYIYCRHKHGWKLSLELLKHIQNVMLASVEMLLSLFKKIEMFICFTYKCEYLCICGLQKYLIAKGGEFIVK